MKAGVRIVLAHEMPGVGQTPHAVPFSAFFACPEGATPAHLLKAGLYDTIAVPLKAGPWRAAGMALLLKEMTAPNDHDLNHDQEGLAARVRSVEKEASVPPLPPPLKRRQGGRSRRALVDPNPKSDDPGDQVRHVIRSRAGPSNFSRLVEPPPTYEAATGRGSGAIERARTARACPSKFSVLRVLRRDADRSRQYLAERPSIKLLTSNGAEESGKGSADGCSTSAYGVPSAHLLTAQL